MNFSSDDIATMRQALVDLRTQIEETGPCDHPVNVCVCALRTTYENLGDLFYRITDRRVGFTRKVELIDLVEFSRVFLNQTNVERAAALKAEADARNAQFKKGTIND